MPSKKEDENRKLSEEVQMLKKTKRVTFADDEVQKLKKSKTVTFAENLNTVFYRNPETSVEQSRQVRRSARLAGRK